MGLDEVVGQRHRLADIEPVVLDSSPVVHFLMYEVGGINVLRGREKGSVYDRSDEERLDTFRKNIARYLEESKVPAEEVSIVGKGVIVEDWENKVFYATQVSQNGSKGYRNHTLIGLLKLYVSNPKHLGKFENYAIVSDGKPIVHNEYTRRRVAELESAHQPVVLGPHIIDLKPANTSTVRA